MIGKTVIDEKITFILHECRDGRFMTAEKNEKGLFDINFRYGYEIRFLKIGNFLND